MDLEERNKLVEDNINLVYYIVNRYFNNYGDREEFISEGSMGLIRAANTYDKTKKIKFSTYACRCIYNEISKYLNIQNYNCRRANVDALSIDNTIYDNNEKLTFKELLECEEDYSVANVSYLLDLIDTLNVKDGKYACVKKAEGYSLREIADVLGVSKEAVRQKICRVKRKLIKLGVSV